MFRRFQHLLAMFFVLWLPLQSATALAMPIGSCIHSKQASAHVAPLDVSDHVSDYGSARFPAAAPAESAAHGHAHAEHGVPGAHAHHSVEADVGDHAGMGTHAGLVGDVVADDVAADVANVDPSNPCNDCGLCQFACASALTSTVQRLPVPRAGAVADTVAFAFHSVTLSLPQRPPRTA